MLRNAFDFVHMHRLSWFNANMDNVYNITIMVISPHHSAAPVINNSEVSKMRGRIQIHPQAFKVN